MYIIKKLFLFYFCDTKRAEFYFLFFVFHSNKKTIVFIVRIKKSSTQTAKKTNHVPQIRCKIYFK
jgi:hypothetical protein